MVVLQNLLEVIIADAWVKDYATKVILALQLYIGDGQTRRLCLTDLAQVELAMVRTWNEGYIPTGASSDL